MTSSDFQAHFSYYKPSFS